MTFVDQNMRFGSNTHSSASSFSSNSSMGSSFSSDSSSWDSSSIIDTPVHTPSRTNFDFVELDDASLCTPTPAITPERNWVDLGFCNMSSMTQDMAFSDLSMMFAPDGKPSEQAMKGYNNFTTYVGPAANSFSNQNSMSLDSQSFDDNLFSPISDLGSSPAEDFVVPSQITFMDTFNIDSPLRPGKSLHFDLSYGTPISDHESGFEQFISPNYEEVKPCSTTPSRSTPLRPPILEPLPTTAALQRVQEDSPSSREEVKRELVARRALKARKRVEQQTFLPNNVDHVKLPNNQCIWAGCTKRFARQEHLKRHVKTHTQEDSFTCPFCLRLFGRADNLKSHIKLHAQPHSKRTPHDPRAQEFYDAMRKKSAVKSEKHNSEDDGGLKTRSRARSSGY